jgi:hypothetical protein
MGPVGLNIWHFTSGLAQGLILLLVTLAVSMLKDVRSELKTLNGRVIRVEQWKEDRPCESGKNQECRGKHNQ